MHVEIGVLLNVKPVMFANESDICEGVEVTSGFVGESGLGCERRL